MMPAPPANHRMGEFDPGNALASFRAITLAVLFRPPTFFAAMRRTGGLVNPDLYLVGCVLVNTVLVGFLNKNVRLMIQSLALGITFPFITAGLMHFILSRLLGVRSTYETALRVNAYAAAVKPVSWFPVGGVFLEFYRVYVITRGLSLALETTVRKALLAVALTIVRLMLAALTGGRYTAAP